MRLVTRWLVVAALLAGCSGQKEEAPPYIEQSQAEHGVAGGAAGPPAVYATPSNQPGGTEPIVAKVPAVDMPTTPEAPKPMDPMPSPEPAPPPDMKPGAYALGGEGGNAGWTGDGAGAGDDMKAGLAAPRGAAAGKLDGTLGPASTTSASTGTEVDVRRNLAEKNLAADPSTVFEPEVLEEEDEDSDGYGDDARERSKDTEKKEEKQKPKQDLGRFARRDGDMVLVPPAVDAERFVRPATVLPRIFYFENTYLGGSAAYAERLRRLESALSEGERHYRQAKAEAQPFDPPLTDGLGVTASVDATHIEGPQRVFLQVGLQGSDRYGWRRPPLDVALVVDPSALALAPGVATRFVIDLLRKLGTADRLAIIVAGATPERFLELARTPSAQQHLARGIDGLETPRAGASLGAAMRLAGQVLAEASEAEAVVPGSQTILVLTGAEASAAISDAAAAAHDLTVQGAVTSVFTLDTSGGAWWQVANAGYGNFHRIDGAGFPEAIDEELASLARVVARLVRVNIRLGKDASAIRVLGTRVLDEDEVRAVKAREVATDINLSKTLGITSDRGEDDDGIQTVIPYFYGDDSHVILVELWVEKPGLVADVTVRYKDMVNLDNATARTSVKLGPRPQAPTREQTLIAQNVRGFMLAESLQRASHEVRKGNAATAIRNLEAARAMAETTNALDVQAVEGLQEQVRRGQWQYDAGQRKTLEESLLISGQRRVGDTEQK